MKTKDNTDRPLFSLIRTIGMGLAVLFISVTAFVGHQYFRVTLRSAFNVETMPLSYELVGNANGETKLLLIHGLTGSKNYWKRELEDISSEHQLLMVDLLGFGDSPKPNSDYSMEVQLEAIEKIVVEQGFNDGKTIIVGHSMGSIITLAILAKHPDWFGGVVVIALPVFNNKEEFARLMEKHSVFDQLAAGSFSQLVCMFQPLFVNTAFQPDNMPNSIWEDLKKHTWQSYSNSLNDIVIGTDVYGIAQNIKDKKVLFIHGEKDTSAPIASARSLAELFTDATFITVKDADHQLFLSDPKMVWQTIADFLMHQKQITNHKNSNNEHHT